MTTQERDNAITQMSKHYFSVMTTRVNENIQLDALSICEEWVVNGKDPQDEDTAFIFIPNTTFGDWTWEV